VGEAKGTLLGKLDGYFDGRTEGEPKDLWCRRNWMAEQRVWGLAALMKCQGLAEGIRLGIEAGRSDGFPEGGTRVALLGKLDGCFVGRTEGGAEGSQLITESTSSYSFLSL
jgi:hypothetical protein